MHSPGFTPGHEAQKEEGTGAESDAKGKITAEFHSGERCSKEISQQRSWRGRSAQAGKEQIQK